MIALWHGAGRDLPLAPQGLQVGDGRLRGLRAARSRRDAAPPDPRRALSALGARVLRQGGQRVPPPHQGDAGLRPDGGLHEDAARPLHGDAAVRPRLVRRRGDGLPAQGRRRGAAVLRAVQAQGLRRAPRRASPRSCGRTSITPTRTAIISHIFAAVSQAVAAAARQASTRSGASSARTSATSPTTSCCSARCSTTSTRCWACRSRSSTCGPSRRASWTWRTRARRAQLTPSFVVGSSLLQGRPEKELAYVDRQEADADAPRSLRPLAARSSRRSPS